MQSTNRLKNDYGKLDSDKMRVWAHDKWYMSYVLPLTEKIMTEIGCEKLVQLWHFYDHWPHKVGPGHSLPASFQALLEIEAFLKMKGKRCPQRDESWFPKELDREIFVQKNGQTISRPEVVEKIRARESMFNMLDGFYNGKGDFFPDYLSGSFSQWGILRGPVMYVLDMGAVGFRLGTFLTYYSLEVVSIPGNNLDDLFGALGKKRLQVPAQFFLDPTFSVSFEAGRLSGMVYNLDTVPYSQFGKDHSVESRVEDGHDLLGRLPVPRKQSEDTGIVYQVKIAVVFEEDGIILPCRDQDKVFAVETSEVSHVTISNRVEGLIKQETDHSAPFVDCGIYSNPKTNYVEAYRVFLAKVVRGTVPRLYRGLVNSGMGGASLFRRLSSFAKMVRDTLHQDPWRLSYLNHPETTSSYDHIDLDHDFLGKEVPPKMCHDPGPSQLMRCVRCVISSLGCFCSRCGKSRNGKDPPLCCHTYRTSNPLTPCSCNSCFMKSLHEPNFYQSGCVFTLDESLCKKQ